MRVRRALVGSGGLIAAPRRGRRRLVRLRIRAQALGDRLSLAWRRRCGVGRAVAAEEIRGGGIDLFGGDLRSLFEISELQADAAELVDHLGNAGREQTDPLDRLGGEQRTQVSDLIEAIADIVLDLGLAERLEVPVGDRAVLHEGLIRGGQAFDQLGLTGEDHLQQPGPALFDLGQAGEADQEVVGYRVGIVDQNCRRAAIVDLADQQVGESVHLADALDLPAGDAASLAAGLDQLVEGQHRPAGIDD